MNCEQFEQLAPQIAHNELRDGKAMQDVTNHAAECGACEAILVEARELAGLVASLAAQDKLLEVPARMESSLRAAFVRKHTADARSRKNVFVGATFRVCVATSKSAISTAFSECRFVATKRLTAFYEKHKLWKSRLSHRLFRWAAVSLVAAAIILAVVLLPRILNRKPEVDRAAATPAQSASPAVSGTKIVQAPTAVERVPQKRLATAHKPKKNLAEPETTLTGFLALPYADDLSTIEYGAIVRLQMSRSDLAWLGLPVPISDTGEKVVADLFVNGSGTPEAIRLVR
jgi:hypothetical protein